MNQHPPGTHSGLTERLNIRPGELPRTLLLFLYLFLVGVIFTAGRTARDALFLDTYPTRWLPWMSVAYAAVSAAVVPLYAAVADRYRRDRLNAGFALAVAGVYGLAWALIELIGFRPAVAGLYVFVEISSNLLLVQFWTLSGDLHDPREAKRLFGVIGSGRMIGTVFCGLAVGAVVGMTGTSAILLIIAGLLVLTAWTITVTGRRFVRAAPATRVSGAAPAAALWRSAYVGWIVALFIVTYTVATIGDYQFKVIAREHYTGEKLAAYFALFNGATGALAFVFQFFVSSRLLAAFGMAAGLIVMPVLMGAGNLWLWLTAGSLAAATAIKFSDNAFQFTINDSAIQLLYYPFGPQVKARLKSLIEGVVKPVGYGVGGLLVAAIGVGLGPVRLAWVALPLIALWIVTVAVLRKRYLDSLVQSLARRRLETGEIHLAATPEIIRELTASIRTGNDFQAGFALDELREIAPAQAGPVLESLLGDPARRGFALRRIQGADVPPARVEPFLDDPDPEVRLAAIAAYGALRSEEAIERFGRIFLKGDPGEIDAAVVSLIRNAGLEGVLASADHIRRLLSGGDNERIRAARIIGESEVKAFGRSLLGLMDDASTVVRREAFAAAGKLANPRLLPRLIDALGDFHLRSVAAGAIERYGEAAMDGLGGALQDNSLPVDTRLRIPQLIRRIDRPGAAEILWNVAGTPDESLRTQVLHHVARLRERWKLPVARAEINRLLSLEGETACRWLSRMQYLEDGDRLLSEAVEQRIRFCWRRVFSLLRLKYPYESISRIRYGIESGDRIRAGTAIEALDNLLDQDDRSWIVPLIDPQSRGEAYEALRDRYPRFAEDEAAARRFLTGGSDPYLAAVWVRSLPRAAQSGLPADDSFLSPLVIEELYFAAAGDGSSAGSLLEAARKWRVRRVIEHDQSRSLPGGPYRMLTTLERVLFLKGVSLFQQVAGDDLVGLAEAAHAVTYEAGQTVFEAGDPGDALYLIVHGKVRVYLGGNDLAELGPGECFGEMAILDNAMRSASVAATEPLLALRITQEDFFEILVDRPEISRGVFAVLTARLRKSDERIRELIASRQGTG
ncbi:MAG: cyclic nucleotide-binding domain-containing protein [Deltaproteobacteria bacterium]|nr:cyclic nucleotide-binding domain-containing protein [Deltaproteobacteria bacterium]